MTSKEELKKTAYRIIKDGYICNGVDCPKCPFFKKGETTKNYICKLIGMGTRRGFHRFYNKREVVSFLVKSGTYKSEEEAFLELL